MAKVLPPKPLRYLCHHIRTELTALADDRFPRVFVGGREPPAAAGHWDTAVVLRVDGSVRTSAVTREVTVGVRVRAGDDLDDPGPAEDLAGLVLAFLENVAGTQPGNPVAALVSSSGPFNATEPGTQPVQYFTISFSMVGEVLNN
ncbi:hypothetical protein ACSYDW_01340 [Paeniglutamicibacter sp. R2-26]|uniref:hypothetical protein n=1 Tax=Paeniglutamicibacter sp. R2-26 TaxID=3144417 RepID=UPI003EE75D00